MLSAVQYRAENTNKILLTRFCNSFFRPHRSRDRKKNCTPTLRPKKLHSRVRNLPPPLKKLSYSNSSYLILKKKKLITKTRQFFSAPFGYRTLPNIVTLPKTKENP